MQKCINSVFDVLQVLAVYVEPQTFDSYYNGCCNGTFWPLFHSMPDRAVFSSDTWKVNENTHLSYRPNQNQLFVSFDDFICVRKK